MSDTLIQRIYDRLNQPSSGPISYAFIEQRDLLVEAVRELEDNEDTMRGFLNLICILQERIGQLEEEPA